MSISSTDNTRVSCSQYSTATIDWLGIRLVLVFETFAIKRRKGCRHNAVRTCAPLLQLTSGPTSSMCIDNGRAPNSRRPYIAD